MNGSICIIFLTAACSLLYCCPLPASQWNATLPELVVARLLSRTHTLFLNTLWLTIHCAAPLPPGLITWLISRDIHTATAVSRNFFWTDVNLWPDEIPQSSLFVLSERVSWNCNSAVLQDCNTLPLGCYPANCCPISCSRLMLETPAACCIMQ